MRTKKVTKQFRICMCIKSRKTYNIYKENYKP